PVAGWFPAVAQAAGHGPAGDPRPHSPRAAPCTLRSLDPARPLARRRSGSGPPARGFPGRGGVAATERAGAWPRPCPSPPGMGRARASPVRRTGGVILGVVAVALAVGAVALFTLYMTCGLRGCPDVRLLRGYVPDEASVDRKSTRLNSSHVKISYAVFCLKKKKKC